MDAGKKFDALVEMMESAAVVEVDNETLVYPVIFDLGGSKMIELNWSDDDGTAHQSELEKTDLADLTVSSDREAVVMTHTNGETFRFKPLTVDFDAVIKIGNELGKGSKPKL